MIALCVYYLHRSVSGLTQSRMRGVEPGRNTAVLDGLWILRDRVSNLSGSLK
jgi:hypothetical protein